MRKMTNMDDDDKENDDDYDEEAIPLKWMKTYFNLN